LSEVVQEFCSFVTFDCPRCEESVSEHVVIPEPDWTSAEGLADLTSEGAIYLSCPNCGGEFEGYSYFTHGECTVTFRDFTYQAISADIPHYFPPDDESWILFEPVQKPFDTFQSSVRQLRDISLERNDEDGGSIFNRMCFAQAISACEEYFEDSFNGQNLDNKES
jgi:predicted RNA-binding Zn-ribbon protein involved in translation (DUF1610 family)